MTPRTPLIAGNWKMFKTATEAAETAAQLAKRVGGAIDVEVMIAPPFTALASVQAVIADTNVALGAQNLHWEAQGAYTGEISAGMLAAAGCRYVIIGHSERRQYFFETDENVNQKVRAALEAGLTPIVCVGETEAQREEAQTFAVLERQMDRGLKGFSAQTLAHLVVAYEPVWAIGTGKAATSAQAQEVHAYLREVLEKSYGKPLAKSVRILYGGSVKPANVDDLMRRPDVDGALVGGASLSAETFSQLVLFKK